MILSTVEPATTENISKMRKIDDKNWSRATNLYWKEPNESAVRFLLRRRFTIFLHFYYYL